MTGTDKQIAWAQEIKTATLEAIDKLIADGQKYIGNPKADALLNKLASQRDALNTCDYAGDIIECFSGVKSTDTVEVRCGQFAAACRVAVANSLAQRRLLGK